MFPFFIASETLENIEPVLRPPAGDPDCSWRYRKGLSSESAVNNRKRFLMSKGNSNIILFGGLAAVALFAFSSAEKNGTPGTHHSPGPAVPKTPTEFLKKYYGYAVDSEYATGVPALVTLAQAGLESMWGQKAYGNNYFGIKAGKSWKGQVQKLRTWECSKTSDELIQSYAPHSPGSNDSCNSANKPSYHVYGEFRAYNTPAEGFTDHGDYLASNARYRNAFQYKNDPEQFAKAIAAAGYATAPNYGTVLVDTIKNIRTVLNKPAAHPGSGKW